MSDLLTFDNPLTDEQRDAILGSLVAFQVEVVHLISVLALDAGVSRESLIAALRNTAAKGSQGSRLPFKHWAELIEGRSGPDLTLILGGLSESEV